MAWKSRAWLKVVFILIQVKIAPKSKSQNLAKSAQVKQQQEE